MYFANDENGLRVHIDEATKAGAYTCPACKEPVIMKCGRIVAHHFSHKARKNCDPWYTWYKWEYVDPFFRERYFVEPCFLEWEHLDEFEALYYEEKEFFEILAQYAAKMKSDSTINTQ